MPDFDPSICFLFDNGSRRAAATLSLRVLARRLQDRLAIAVKPVSLLHSSGVDPAALHGQAAELLEPALLRFAEVGGREAVLLPLFFGPSAALTDYVPARLQAVRDRFPRLDARLAECLVGSQDDSAGLIARELHHSVTAINSTAAPLSRHVILVDHGSPQPAVTAVRNEIAVHLARLLGDTVAGVTAASMERRPGPAFAFNEPLLIDALRTVAARPGITEIVIAMQFLQPGRHAGTGGDITRICDEALRGRAAIALHLTPLLGEGDVVLDLLERRWRQCVNADR